MIDNHYHFVVAEFEIRNPSLKVRFILGTDQVYPPRNPEVNFAFYKSNGVTFLLHQKFRLEI